MWSRRGSDLTERFPEVAELAGAVPPGTVLDGELVVLDATGRPDFAGIRRRGLLGEGGAPAVLVVFDLLRLAGRELTGLRYPERRRALEDLGLSGAGWITTPSRVGEGSAMFEATRAQGLEGVVAKRLDSPYRPGVRTTLWVKTKHYRTECFVIGGVVVGEQRCAVLVGTPAADGRLPEATPMTALGSSAVGATVSTGSRTGPGTDH